MLAVVMGAIATAAFAEPRYLDFNGDGETDLLFRLNPVTVWLMDGTDVMQSAEYAPGATWTLRDDRRDRNGDGRTDLVWIRVERDSQYPYEYRVLESSMWLMSGTGFVPHPFPTGVDESISLDLNGDGKSDSIYWNGSAFTVSLMDGPNPVETKAIWEGDRSKWQPQRTRVDFNGDGKEDLLWARNYSPPLETAVWLMDGTKVLDAQVIYSQPITATDPWFIAHAGDLNGDGKTDVVWQTVNGRIAIWLMDGIAAVEAKYVSAPEGWFVVTGADFDGDGKDDLLWEKRDTGEAAIWLMDGMSVKAAARYRPDGGPWFVHGPLWYLSPVGDFNGDGKADLLWQAYGSPAAVWLMDGLSVLETKFLPSFPPNAQLATDQSRAR